MARPQTIQIFLPDGNPRGVRIADITNRTVKGYCFLVISLIMFLLEVNYRMSVFIWRV